MTQYLRYWHRVGIVLCCAILVTGCGGPRASMGPPSQPAIAVATSQPFSLSAGAHAVHLYVEPDDGKRVISTAILHARHSLLLEMYLLTDRVLLHDLEHAAANGVAV